jgi:ethanolamine utilization protein EutQ (cupin superfamily)
MKDYFAQFEKLAWENPALGVKCKTVKNYERQVRLVEFTQEMIPHWCEVGHYGLILEGELEIEFQNATHIYKAGEGLLIPEGEAYKHKGKVLSELVRAIFVENV